MTITIIDYSLLLPRVDIYTDVPEVEGDKIERFIEDLGYHTSNCSWMCSDSTPKVEIEKFDPMMIKQ